MMSLYLADFEVLFSFVFIEVICYLTNSVMGGFLHCVSVNNCLHMYLFFVYEVDC